MWQFFTTMFNNGGGAGMFWAFVFMVWAIEHICVAIINRNKPNWSCDKD